jgi:glycosyltransferase involved in cell wall biosynthesis
VSRPERVIQCFAIQAMSRASGSSEKMRVLRIITRLNIGGPSIQAIALTERLAGRGVETRLIHGRLGTGEGDMRYLLTTPAAARQLTALRRQIAPVHDTIALVQVLDTLRDFRPQIIHTHMAKAGTIGRVAASIYNRTASRDARVRVVHTYHGHVLEGYFSPARTRAFLGVERLLARATDRLVAVSPRIEHELIADYSIGRPDQYRVIPLGFDLRRMTAIGDAERRTARAALDLTPDAHVISTAGRLTAIKRHDLFLDTARLVAERDRRAVFLVAGDGELRSALEQQARDGGIADRVRFLGWRRDLDTLYAASDVFLLTSRNEGTPVALIESLAAAVPGVSTDVGGVRDVIDSDRVGLVAPFGDARALADHVLALTSDPERRRRMGEAGRQTVSARYGLDRLLDDVERLYRELLH